MMTQELSSCVVFTLFCSEMIQSAPEISSEISHQKSHTHQHFTCVHFVRTFQTVSFVRIKAIKVNSSAVYIGLSKYLYIRYQYLGTVFCRRSPTVIQMIFSVGCNSEIVSLTDQIMVFVIHLRLLRNHISLFFCNLCDIQLIAECAGKCHMTSRLNRLPPLFSSGQIQLQAS